MSASTKRRPQSPAEELANSVSHGLGLLAALIGVPVLVLTAVAHGSAVAIVGASVFAASTVLLYLASTLYHACPPHGPKRALRVLDHVAIYILIAGTYTPFTLGVLRGAWGWSLFGVVWGLTVAGIVLKLLGGVRYPRLSVALYLAMGWVAVVAIGPLLERMPAWGLFWIVLGGVAYTGGVVFYRAYRLRFHHLVWHLCVLAGTTCHFIAVLYFAL